MGREYSGIKKQSGISVTGGLFLLLILFFLIGIWNANSYTPEPAPDTSGESSAPKPVSKPTSSRQKKTKPSNWKVSKVTSEIDDSQNVFIQTYADRTIPGAIGQAVLPVLWIVCRENKTNLYINWKTFINTQAVRVTYRIDSHSARHMTMQPSTDNSSTGLWSGGAAIPFVKKLMSADKLLMRVTPFNANTATVKFDVHGLAKAIAPLRKACHW